MSINDDVSIQEKLDAPMPLIGMYVALASLAISLTMAGDLLHGCRSNKLWFPPKYFSLNATSLTLLSVALKLPIDLTTNMSAVTDRLAKISSLALISTAMANFTPSLGSMSYRDILLNVAALAILIVTVVADVIIQVVGTRSFLHHRVLFPEEIISLTMMVVLLLVLVSTAVMVLKTKKCLEAKYREKHNFASVQQFSDVGEDIVIKLRSLVKKYWVMAETSNPQFVVARSTASAAAGVICLANALILAQAVVRTAVAHRSLSLTGSTYACSTKFILLAQSVGIVVGTISASFRWWIAVRFRYSCGGRRSLKEAFKVEDYWTRKLLEWRESSISKRIKHHKCRQFLYKARGLFVHLILRAQIGVVLFNKLVLVISCLIAAAFIKLIQRLKNDDQSREIGGGLLENVRRDSLRLEGEADLPDYMLQSIPKRVDEMLEASRKNKPSSLIEFLRNSKSFKGVAEFDSPRVESLHGKEPENCWSLPLVTLTSIAVSLPNIEKTKVDRMVNNVREGLSLVKIVEKSFYKNEEWRNIRKGSDYWLRVDLFNKWHEIDLDKISSTCSDSKQALKTLKEKSKLIASDLKTDVKACPMYNPSNWPARIIAANSMYRISTTILDFCDEENAVSDEVLFDKLCSMMSDILAACFTNLPRVIAKKCHLKSIEDRERSVRKAARLLGRSEEILDFLAQRDVPPGLKSDHGAVYIEEWRAAMFVETELSSYAITPSCNGTASSEGVGSCSSARIKLMEHLQRSFQPRDLEL